MLSKWRTACFFLYLLLHQHLSLYSSCGNESQGHFSTMIKKKTCINLGYLIFLLYCDTYLLPNELVFFYTYYLTGNMKTTVFGVNSQHLFRALNTLFLLPVLFCFSCSLSLVMTELFRTAQRSLFSVATQAQEGLKKFLTILGCSAENRATRQDL